MNRRGFLQLVSTAVPFACLRTSWARSSAPHIALTFDDPTTEGGANLGWQEVNERILGTLAKRKLKAVLFVCGKRVDTDAGRQLISGWDRAGHGIGNHSFSHLNFNSESVGLNAFESDVLKNETLIRRYHNSFHCSDSHSSKKAIPQRNATACARSCGSMGIGADAQPWILPTGRSMPRLDKRAKTDPATNFASYHDFFLQHVWERAQFYNSLAQRVVGRTVRHTVLLHHNALNALFLDDLIAMFLSKGWRPEDAAWAYEDGIYDRQPNILPAGESLIWALAKETGRFDKELRYPGEDDIYENPKMDALKL